MTGKYSFDINQRLSTASDIGAHGGLTCLWSIAYCDSKRLPNQSDLITQAVRSSVLRAMFYCVSSWCGPTSFTKLNMTSLVLRYRGTAYEHCRRIEISSNLLLHRRLTALAMRLLHVAALLESGRLELEEFIGSDVPSYAILSHTWGHDEVLYSDIASGRAHARDGLRKIHFTVSQARSHRRNTSGLTPAALISPAVLSYKKPSIPCTEPKHAMSILRTSTLQLTWILTYSVVSFAAADGSHEAGLCKSRWYQEAFNSSFRLGNLCGLFLQQVRTMIGVHLWLR